MDDALLSVGRESIVYLEDGKVIKSYAPEDHLIFGPIKDLIFKDCTYRNRDMTARQRESFFRTEAATLGALEGYVPPNISLDPSVLEIKMDFVPLPTVQGSILSGDLDPISAADYMVGIVAELHNYANENFEGFRNRVRFDGIPRLAALSESHEISKWTNYLRTIVFYSSSGMQQYWKKEGIDPTDFSSSRRSLDEVRGYIDNFMMGRGIDLKSRVTEFIHRDRFITGNETSFVLPESRPQNIFYDEKGDVIRMIDFPRARVGAGSDINLVNTLYHALRGPFSPENEMDSVEIAKRYFAKIGISGTEISQRLDRLQASRIKESIRALANYCQKSPYEIKKDSETIGDVSNPDSNAVKEEFIKEKIQDESDLLEHYRFRDGEGRFVSGRSKNNIMRTLVKAQFDCIDEILTQGGVIEKKKSKRRLRGMETKKRRKEPLLYGSN